ncbi:hypothetical protein ACFLZN_02320 [Nanoarchaeota archaeon]
MVTAQKFTEIKKEISKGFITTLATKLLDSKKEHKLTKLLASFGIKKMDSSELFGRMFSDEGLARLIFRMSLNPRRQSKDLSCLSGILSNFRDKVPLKDPKAFPVTAIGYIQLGDYAMLSGSKGARRFYKSAKKVIEEFGDFRQLERPTMELIRGILPTRPYVIGTIRELVDRAEIEPRELRKVCGRLLREDALLRAELAYKETVKHKPLWLPRIRCETSTGVFEISHDNYYLEDGLIIIGLSRRPKHYQLALKLGIDGGTGHALRRIRTGWGLAWYDPKSTTCAVTPEILRVEFKDY